MQKTLKGVFEAACQKRGEKNMILWRLRILVFIISVICTILVIFFVVLPLIQDIESKLLIFALGYFMYFIIDQITDIINDMISDKEEELKEK